MYCIRSLRFRARSSKQTRIQTGRSDYAAMEKDIRPMRYTCRLAGKPALYDRKFPGTYNARRDNLEGFWSQLYGTHCIAWVGSFFENVPHSSH